MGNHETFLAYDVRETSQGWVSFVRMRTGRMYNRFPGVRLHATNRHDAEREARVKAEYAAKMGHGRLIVPETFEQITAGLEGTWDIPCMMEYLHGSHRHGCIEKAQWILWIKPCCEERTKAVTLCPRHLMQIGASDRYECERCHTIVQPARLAFRDPEPLHRSERS